MKARNWTPIVVLAIGFGFSLAANILWTLPGGPVRILGGALASIALPACVHMWPMVPAGDRRSRTLRNLVMGAVAVGAAVTTFSHASALLIAAGELVWLSYAYPVITELLVIFAVLTRQATPKQRRSVPDAPSARRSAPTPAPANEVAGRRADRGDRVAWLRARAPERATDEIAALRAEFGVSMSTAKRIRGAAGRVAS